MAAAASKQESSKNTNKRKSVNEKKKSGKKKGVGSQGSSKRSRMSVDTLTTKESEETEERLGDGKCVYCDNYLYG